MSTKFFNHEAGFSPYQTPYEAFINFMNIVSDFAEQLNKVPSITKLGTLTKDELDAEIAKHSAILKELEEAKKKQKEAKTTTKKTEKVAAKKSETKPAIKEKKTTKATKTEKEKKVTTKTTKSTTKKQKTNNK